MTSKFSRFLHLERSRGERPQPEEPSRLQHGNRFERMVERGEGPPGAVVPETHLERFRGEAPLALAEVPQGEGSFPRCARCESENGRYASACGVCGADLNTPEQREYNERFRQARQAQEREMAEALAQAQQQAEARQREEEAHKALLRARLRADPWGDKEDSFGMELLKFIPSKPVRWGIVAAIFLLPWVIAFQGPVSWRRTAAVVTVVLMLLFVPPSKWVRRD